MPSPFPGMDPYLEDPTVFPGVHAGLIGAFQAQLNRRIRPRYVATVQERVFVEAAPDPARDAFYPDVTVRRGRGRARSPAGGGTAVAESMAVKYTGQISLRERRIEIVNAASRAVVAVIEVHSPSNKMPGAAAQGSFLLKKGEVMQTAAHWVEIDLLRAGRRDEYRAAMPPHAYAAAVFPATTRPAGRAWPIQLADPLPVIEIPLRGVDSPVPLDLQAALVETYDRGAYEVIVDYAADPPRPRLAPELAKWAADLLAAAGLRKRPRGRK